MAGILRAVCVVGEIRPLSRKGVVDSAIDKRPVDGPVRIGELGVEGDRSCDTTFHGGHDQAVYAYSAQEAERWAQELGRDLPPGWFGENLRVDGMAVTDAVVGSHWRIGTAELEVTIARTPCGTFAKWCGEPHWVKRFTERSDCGAYLRVLHPGAVRAGDAIEVTSVPDHGVTVRDLFVGTDADKMRRVMNEKDLAPKVYRDAAKALQKATRS
ncbi:MOSC domain-containing protein [Actinomycetes bacterium M1A6_2h]